jgi:hypothetical protein
MCTAEAIYFFWVRNLIFKYYFTSISCFIVLKIRWTHNKYQFMWSLFVTGQSLNTTGYRNFATGQPNNSPLGIDPDQDCGGVTRSGLLNDLPCNTRYGFFCEMELPKWQLEEAKIVEKDLCFSICACPVLVLFRKSPPSKQCLLLL